MRSTSLSFVVGIMACTSNAADSAAVNARLTGDDERAIRAVDSAYVNAWLRDDTAAVLATLEPDVVLMPAGQHPLANAEAIRGFWWPSDGSHTKILTFDRHIDELDGRGDVAWTRGTDSLTFTYQKPGAPTASTGNRTMTLAVLRRQPGGGWRISRMMWGTRTN